MGSLSTNCYLLSGDGELAVIDPGGEEEIILEEIRSLPEEVSLSSIILTHGHWDHIGAVGGLLGKYEAPLLIGKEDRELLQKSDQVNREPDRLLEEGDSVLIGQRRLEVWSTPGHSPGSITLVEEEEKNLFVGDLIFAGGFGRTDLPGGSSQELEKSIQRLLSLDGDWEIMPGHGNTTTDRKSVV